MSRPPKVRLKNLTFGGLIMSKYNFDTKLQIVADYIAGEGGYKRLAKKYQIDVSNIKRWIHHYQDFGLEGLYRKTSKRHFPVETKLYAIELYLETDLSYREVGIKLNINNPSLIANWLRTFKLKGIDGLSKPIGRPSTMSKYNNKNDKKQNNKVSTNEMTRLKQRIQELEDQNKALDIENKFLKELRRLREADIKQHKNK